jgi:nitrite reductase/ring-hydroxylating ferredoxin subunit
VRGLDGSLHALRDRCAHAGARLSNGRLLRQVVGDDVDRYRLVDKVVLRCPWHGYEYDLDTGRCLADPTRVRVRTYEVLVEDGTIHIELPGKVVRKSREVTADLALDALRSPGSS